MQEDTKKPEVVKVFFDILAHKLTADLIKKHSSNSEDIRQIALDRLPLKRCRNILDLGCGFGFFSEALKGKVHPKAEILGLDVIEAYEPSFLEACKKAGIKGRFAASGVSFIKDFPDASFDLILCSYALYFFPELIPEISRILKRQGFFIVITHDTRNMEELIQAAKEILRAGGKIQSNYLPIEEIINQFSAQNGDALLKPWFGEIQSADYKNALTFKATEFPQVVEYFRFKGPFFVSGTDMNVDSFVDLLSVYVQELCMAKNGFVISKDDRIFVCSLPLYKRSE
jgi:ubiquinone/menaquinone biosynthesis C-methylase UbiE